jgi:isoleucyl-tRNA synthetase
MEHVAQRMEHRGIEAWFDLKADELLGQDAVDYEKVNDTLDVWFDSGVSHFCVLKEAESLGFPADVYFEGSDQHRGWFNSSLTTAVAMYGATPYKTVLTHGYTVDAEGKKLSKSKGNYVALDKLIEQHGADVLRLWVSSTDYRNEVSISEEIIKRNGDAYRRIRNTARFLLANLFDFVPGQHNAASDELVELDRWAIQRTQQLQEEILTAYEQYHFHLIYQKIHNFCAVDLGSFYLDIIKDRQYTTPIHSIARRSCQTAMHHILQALVRWLAPIVSFTADEIWQAMPGYSGDTIFVQQWYTEWPTFKHVDMKMWQQLQAIRDEVNRALETQRQAGLIGSGLSADVVLYAPQNLCALLERLKDELRFVWITSTARVLPLEQAPNDLQQETTLGVVIEVQASSHKKCERCWHRRSDVGEDQNHPTLCVRCAGNITGKDEVRYFA